MGRNGGMPEETSEGRRQLPREMYNFYEEALLEGDEKTYQEGEEEAFEARRLLPTEMYNFYNMDQYMTSGSHDQASHKDFDIWLNDFEKQVGAGYW